jgi:hypothetical protein
MITSSEVDEFVKALDQKNFFEAHEVLEKIWFVKRFEDTNEIKLLKGFINACVSFELHKRGRANASARVWKTYLKYRQLLFKTGSHKVKLYYVIFLKIENTKKGLS